MSERRFKSEIEVLKGKEKYRRVKGWEDRNYAKNVQLVRTDEKKRESSSVHEGRKWKERCDVRDSTDKQKRKQDRYLHKMKEE